MLLESVKDPFRDHWVWCDHWPITQWSQISDSFEDFLAQRCPQLAGSSRVSLVQCSAPDNHTYSPWPPNSACSGKDWNNPILMPSSLWAGLFTNKVTSAALACMKTFYFNVSFLEQQLKNSFTSSFTTIQHQSSGSKPQMYKFPQTSLANSVAGK